MNALSNLHPQREMEGCFYHLCANTYRSGCFWLYLLLYRNINKAWCCRCVIAKSQLVVPPQNVSDEFDALPVPIRNVKKNAVDYLLGYFKDTYIGRNQRNVPRGAPLFDITLWNIYHRTDDVHPRTTNKKSTWHKGL